MQIAVLIQKTKQAVNTSKDIYDMQRSHASLLDALDISGLTDADFAPYGMSKAQYQAAAAGLAALIAAFEANDTALMEIYG